MWFQFNVKYIFFFLFSVVDWTESLPPTGKPFLFTLWYFHWNRNKIKFVSVSLSFSIVSIILQSNGNAFGILRFLSIFDFTIQQLRRKRTKKIARKGRYHLVDPNRPWPTLHSSVERDARQKRKGKKNNKMCGEFVTKSKKKSKQKDE